MKFLHTVITKSILQTNTLFNPFISHQNAQHSNIVLIRPFDLVPCM